MQAALRTMALLTLALLALALRTMAVLTLAVLTMALRTMAVLAMALLTMGLCVPWLYASHATPSYAGYRARRRAQRATGHTSRAAVHRIALRCLP